MSTQDTIYLSDGDSVEDPEIAMRDARQRFIAAFPKRADSIGLLLNMVATLGPKGPVAPLLEIVHRTAGLGGTLGFPTVSARAHDLEGLLAPAAEQLVDAIEANRLFDELRDGFAEDLAVPPTWALASSTAAKARRIMVVEDDEDQREVVSIHLRAAGYTVLPVGRGDLAVDAARQLRPDLILLDANLPGLDGYSACRLLKADPDLARTPIVFTTIRAKVDDKAVGLLLGADEYLTKPLDLGELALRIAVLLDRQSARDAVPATPAAASDAADLDYESFVVVAREQLARAAAVVALVRVPELQLMTSFTALRSELRRRDIVACYDSHHLIILMGEMPPARATERLADIVGAFPSDGANRFVVGLAHSAAGSAKSFESLLAEADRALAAARQRGILAVMADNTVAEPAVALPAPSVRIPVILLADADRSSIETIRPALEAAGWRVVIATESDDLPARCAGGAVDAVVMDLAWAGAPALDVVSLLRKLQPRPRVLVLTTRGREQDVTRAFAAGADDYVTRPVAALDVRSRIERLLR